MYTKNAFNYVLLPSDLGRDFYVGQGSESDGIQPDRILKWPDQGIASRFRRDLYQKDLWFRLGEEVWVYDTPANAAVALAQLSMQLNQPDSSDVEELDARLGDGSFAITGKSGEAQNVAGPRFFYHSLVQYANVIIRLEVLAKSLPKAAMTQYQQLAQSKLTAPVPTPTPMMTVPIENWVLASKTDIDDTVVELLEGKMIPMEQLKSQLRPGAPIDRDTCLALRLKITNKGSSFPNTGELTVIDKKTGYIYSLAFRQTRIS